MNNKDPDNKDIYKDNIGAVRWIMAVAVIIICIAGVVWGVYDNGDTGGAGPMPKTVPVVRDRLVVTVTESGEIEARDSIDVKCEVEGNSTILWIIEEGSTVKKGDRLVELDNAKLREDVTSKKIDYDNSRSSFEQAQRIIEIQKSQNESKLSSSRLDVKFALLDLKKYLGNTLANRLMELSELSEFGELYKEPALGGEALQKKRNLESKINLAREEASRAKSKMEWTRKLYNKGHVTQSEMEADELAYKRRKVELQQAESSMRLFLKYEFPKEAERYYTNWVESGREFERVKVRAKGELAKLISERDARETTLELEAGRLAKAEEQLKKATITAPTDGMVLYHRPSHRRDNPELGVGVSVSHQQTLIEITDLTEMEVKTKLHESVVKQVSENDPATVMIDAWPDRRLTGKITKISVMPDKTLWWLNPGVKTYMTHVELDEVPAGLKPGMSAQVEIRVEDRQNVLQVPLTAVHMEKGYPVVYADVSGKPEIRRVEIGLSNEKSVEIQKGVSEGEYIYINPPPNAPILKTDDAGKQTKAS